jgi:hypothetical protein
MLLRISLEICGRLGNPGEGRFEVKSRKRSLYADRGEAARDDEG